VGAGVASADPALPPVSGTTAVSGATIVGEQWLTQRTLQLMVATPSFTTPAPVEVTLPTGYSDDSTRRWPTTYYLIGTNGNETMFRTRYNGEALTTSYPSIVISPGGSAPLPPGTPSTASTGNVGYWSDWYNNGAGGPPMYETFVTQQLIPLIDANFRTLADRGHRAILGESMGGYGTLMLAARHPDLFGAASSLSGADDSNWVPGAAVLSASPALDVAPPDSIYGPRATEEVNWRGHNPVDLAENLRRIDLQLYTGNGVPNVNEATDPSAPGGCVLESGIVNPETQSLHNTLLSLGIPHTYTALTYGCHTPYEFEQEIASSLTRFASDFATGAPAVTDFDYRSTAPTFSMFGWSVTADPGRAAEFLDVQNVSASGFTITGSGTTEIVTPPLLHGARPVTVMVDGRPSSITPDTTGRLSISVDLGPPDQDQQYTVGAITTLHTSVVTIVTP
jgi:S-formylglutathione hydrolase FrmB